MEITQKVREMTGIAPDTIPYSDLVEAEEPVVLKGVLGDWPLVKAGLESAETAMAYMQGFDAGRQVVMYTLPYEANGRLFYTEDMSGPNYQPVQASFNDFLDAVRGQLGQPEPLTHYIGSRDANMYFPGLRDENDLPLGHPMFEHGNLLVSVWMGSKSTAAAHYDVSHNLACCMVGKRRFTLFPPEAVHCLYPGPLEPTPGGQVLTMVDFKNPDLEKYPRFEEAVAMGQVADIEPGDILYFPALWWHQVEALAPFNIMVNYWWNDVPLHIDDPQSSLMMAMLSLRDRPEQEKKAWQEIFNYYVFGDADTVRDHLPEHTHGALGPMDAMTARRLRAQILRSLNR